MVQCLGIRASTEGDAGSIPDWETKIPQASWPGQKKKKVLFECKNSPILASSVFFNSS